MRKQETKIQRDLSPSEIASRLGVSRSSVYTLVRLGYLPRFTKLPGLRRVTLPESALDEYRKRAGEAVPPPTAATA